MPNEEEGEGANSSFSFLGGPFEELTEDYLKQNSICCGIKAASSLHTSRALDISQTELSSLGTLTAIDQLRRSAYQ